MTKFEKIILTAFGLLVVVVLAVGAIVFQQQKAINALTGGATVAPRQSTIQTPVAKKSPPLTEIIKQFNGPIESISGNQLTMNIKLTDFSKPKNPEKVKNAEGPINMTGDDYEVLAKKITVNTNEKTLFAGKKLSDLKVGDVVSVESEKSPYSSDTAVAKKITFIVIH